MNQRMDSIVQSLKKRGNPIEMGNGIPYPRFNHLADYGAAIFAVHRGKTIMVLGNLDKFYGKFGSCALGAFWFHCGHKVPPV
jgi:hypothetical protein